MTETRLSIDGVEPVMLLGSNDKHLRKLESAFEDTTIIARGNLLILKGEEEHIAQLQSVIHEMQAILNRHGNLTENDVETVLQLSASGSKSARSTSDGIILYAPKGGTIRSKTPAQYRLVEEAATHDIVFAVGPAGTGKTYTAVALAVVALKSKRVSRIVLSRPAVEAGESLGFLPGDLRDKVDPYLRPLYDALEDMIPREQLKEYVAQRTIEIVPLAYMRGRTLNSAFVILDEAQNASATQMKMFLTRLGANRSAIVTGDASQTDLPSREISGLVQARKILEGVDGISFVDFSKEDVVRHKLVKEIIAAYDDFNKKP